MCGIGGILVSGGPIDLEVRVQRELDAHRTGQRDSHTRLWLILWLELWFRIVYSKDWDYETDLSMLLTA